MIELAEVVEMATSFLVDQLDPSNAIGIYRYEDIMYGRHP